MHLGDLDDAEGFGPFAHWDQRRVFRGQQVAMEDLKSGLVTSF